MGIVTPLGTEAPNTDAAYKAIADAVDAVAAMFGQGTFAARPVSTPANPGKQGRFYMVTSGAETGQLYYDYGTGWLYVNPPPTTPAPDSITSVELAPNAVTNTEMADNAVGAAEIIDGSVGTAEIANALKPSAGAGAATEALRALGTGGANAAAGNDARLSDQRTPSDGSVTTTKIVDANVTLAKLAGNSVDSSKIVDGAIVNADINAAAAIAFSKLAALPLLFQTALGAAQHKLQAGNASGVTDASGNFSVNFPSAFSNATVYVLVAKVGGAGTGPFVSASNASGFTLNYPGLGAGDGVAVNWLAVGLA